MSNFGSKMDDASKQGVKPGVVTQARNAGACEAEAGGL
jgi:hypothetical protein